MNQVPNEVGVLSSPSREQGLLLQPHIDPKSLGRVRHEQHDLGVTPQSHQQIQGAGRQVVDAKHHDATGQAFSKTPSPTFDVIWVLRRTALQGLNDLSLQMGAVAAALFGLQTLHQGLPQSRLPTLRLGDRRQATQSISQLRATSGPVFKPIGAVILVLVKQVRELGTQLQQAFRNAR